MGNGRGNDNNGYLYFEDVHGDKVSTDIFSGSQAPAAAQPASPQRANISFDFKNVLVYEPTGYNDVEKLIDYLKSRQPAIINLDNASPETAQRVLDFMSGAIYALNGSVVRISGNIFLLSPEGVGITFPQELS